LGVLIYGVDEETLEGSVTKLLEKVDLTLSTVELYTGGMIAQRLSGTGSTRFIQGVVLNSEETIRSFLGIEEGEFSKLKRDRGEFVLFLARKTRERCSGHLGLSVSGYPEKEVSTEGEDIRVHIYIGMASEGMGKWVDYQVGGTKGMLLERTAIIALDTLRKELLDMRNK
jgi:nicotinamide-nucleotide amidase